MGALSRLGIRRGQNRPAARRQFGQRDRSAWLRRQFRRPGVEHRVLEPVGEIVSAAAFTTLLWRLGLAVTAAGRARHADVEVIIMPPPRPDLGKPAAVALGLPA